MRGAAGFNRTGWLLFLMFLGGVCVWVSSLVCLAAQGDERNMVISDNVMEDNGFGIYIGWYGDWDVSITGNTIRGNGEGIRLVNRAAFIEGNELTGNITGIRIDDSHEGSRVANPEDVTILGNDIAGNILYGVENLSGTMIDVSGNWWGDSDGPRHLGSAGPSVPRSDLDAEDSPAPRMEWIVAWRMACAPSDAHVFLLRFRSPISSIADVEMTCGEAFLSLSLLPVEPLAALQASWSVGQKTWCSEVSADDRPNPDAESSKGDRVSGKTVADEWLEESVRRR